jgi:hypothetical protein
MNANNLLLWLSARRQGSWQQFRAAVEELHVVEESSADSPVSDDDVSDGYGLPIYHRLRFNLQGLSHAEFFARGCENGWRVAPPTLAISQQRRGWLGVLCGARSPKLLARLMDSTYSFGIERIQAVECPDQFRMISGDHRILSTIAQETGLLLQMHAPMAILISLPAVDNSVMRHRVGLPFGKDWIVEQFSPSSLGWKAATREDALLVYGGLFRFSLLRGRYAYRRQVLLCAHGLASEIPTRIGKYVMLRRYHRQVLHYDRSEYCLWMPGSCRPPLLVERALILCSGLTPKYEVSTGTLHYPDIPEAVARLASELLRQELIIR